MVMGRKLTKRNLCLMCLVLLLVAASLVMLHRTREKRAEKTAASGSPTDIRNERAFPRKEVKTKLKRSYVAKSTREVWLVGDRDMLARRVKTMDEEIAELDIAPREEFLKRLNDLIQDIEDLSKVVAGGRQLEGYANSFPANDTGQPGSIVFSGMNSEDLKNPTQRNAYVLAQEQDRIENQKRSWCIKGQGECERLKWKVNGALQRAMEAYRISSFERQAALELMHYQP
jgi:hypothetical protein